MSLLKGASRSVLRTASRRAAPLCWTRRAASSMTAESQQKVNLVATLPTRIPLIVLATFCGSRTCRSNRLEYPPKCTLYDYPAPLSILTARRRNEDRSILLTSFPPKILLPKLSSMRLEVLCKVGFSHKG
jgi:hypothetical protein